MIIAYLVLLVSIVFGERYIEPIIFTGGLGGQALEAKLVNAQVPHKWCFKNADWFRIWMNLQEEIPYVSLDCFMSTISPHFDPQTMKFSNTPGVSIRPADFGGMGSVEYLVESPKSIKEKSAYMHAWLTYFEKFGYQKNVSFLSSPFDWRQGPNEYLVNTEWGYPALQKLVEKTYMLNGNRKVHLMGHSLGSPYLGFFLSSFCAEDWKEKYISSFISLGGPFDGSFSAPFLNIIGDNFRQFFKVNQRWLDVVRQVAGTQWMTPQFLGMDRPFLFTKDKPKGYSMNEYQQLLKDANTSISYDIYKWGTKGLKNRAPGVPTHCLYGVDLPTGYSFYVDDLLDPTKNHSVVETANGDSTVHIESLQICDGFANLQTEPVTVRQWPNLAHTPMVYNQTVWEYVLNITARII